MARSKTSSSTANRDQRIMQGPFASDEPGNPRRSPRRPPRWWSSPNPWVANVVAGVFVSLILGTALTWFVFYRDTGSPTTAQRGGAVVGPPGTTARTTTPQTTPPTRPVGQDVGRAGGPISVGDTFHTDEATVTLKALRCGITSGTDSGYLDAPKGQYCKLTIRVRNDGDTTLSSLFAVGWTMFVGRNHFDGDDFDGGNLFPSEAETRDVTFDIPKGVEPSRLEISRDIFSPDYKKVTWVMQVPS